MSSLHKPLAGMDLTEPGLPMLVSSSRKGPEASISA